LTDISPYELQNVTGVFDAVPVGMDQRRAVVFHSAVPGQPAYGVSGKSTFFCQALLDGLSGAAAERTQSDDQEQPVWNVTINSLIKGLGAVLEGVLEKYEMPEVHPKFEVGGLVQDATLLRLSEAPEVIVDLVLEPPEAASYTKLIIEDEQGEPIHTVSKT